MCFSPVVSGSFAIIGAICTVISYAYPALRRDHTYILFAFYTVMEILQTIQYSIVNRCGTLLNRALTEFAYVLVIVQPLLWNVIFYARVPLAQKRVFLAAIFMCLVWIIVNIISRVPSLIQEHGLLRDVAAHQETCTRRRSEKTHLYWQWSMADFHGLNANWLMYLSLWFVPCLVVAQTRVSGLTLVVGAIAGALLTHHYGTWQEFASTWCYISIPLMCLILVDTFLLRRS
jgi:Family of unknown function (DUF5765)